MVRMPLQHLQEIGKNLNSNIAEMRNLCQKNVHFLLIISKKSSRKPSVELLRPLFNSKK